MSVITVPEKATSKGGENKHRSGFMTTTELARLCGVSRFTIINWTKQGKIKATKTIGNHYRIPVSEALSLLKSFSKRGNTPPPDVKPPNRQQVSMTDNDRECGNCLTDDKKNKPVKAKKKNLLHAFGYGVGCGVHIFKGRIIK